MKYQFIKENTPQYRVRELCRVIKIAPSGYYKWRKNPSRHKKNRDSRFFKQIKEVFNKSKKRYGAGRVCKRLRLLGIRCSEPKVKRLMDENGLFPKRRTKFKKTTKSDHKRPYSPNRVNQDFKAERPGQLLTGDIAYIDCKEGTLYLAVVLDVFGRKIAGWSMMSRMTDDLVINALDAAMGVTDVAQDAIFHSDRGSQYCSKRFRNNLKHYKLNQSMSGTGNCYDNAITETFFKTLRAELTYHETFTTRKQARAAIFEFIEVYYNRERAHSSLGYLTPQEFEDRFYSDQGKAA